MHIPKQWERMLISLILLDISSKSYIIINRTTQILLEYQLGRWVPRLRKPRDLYGVSSSGPLSPTRWPYHCEVIDEKIEHIGMFLASFGDSNIGRLTVPNLTSVKTLLVLNSMFQQKYNTNHVYNF